MRIEYWPIDRPMPYPDNPRVNDEAVAAVAKSIGAFGFKVPILVDAGGVIVAGHTRIKAARSLGLSEVPVIVLADLTPEQTRALRIADNQTGTLAEWDMERLRAELHALNDLGCDLDVLGFGEKLEAMLAAADVVNESEDDGDGADAAPAAPKVAVSRVGEVYALGRHRLLCGDATNPADMVRLMEGVQADMLLADPPYAGDDADGGLPAPGDSKAFLVSAFRAADSFLRPGAPIYAWHADRDTALVVEAFQSLRWEMVQCLAWVKNGFALGRLDYQWRHEPCLYGNKPGGMRPWYGAGSPGSVLSFGKPERGGEHPAAKPVDLFAFLLVNSCPPGGVVLDPFAGGGATAIAAERLGMRARMAELSPQYADVIRRRWAGMVYGPEADWVTATPVTEGGAR